VPGDRDAHGSERGVREASPIPWQEEKTVVATREPRETKELCAAGECAKRSPKIAVKSRVQTARVRERTGLFWGKVGSVVSVGPFTPGRGREDRVYRRGVRGGTGRGGYNEKGLGSGRSSPQQAQPKRD